MGKRFAIVIGVAALATTALALATSQAHGGTQTVNSRITIGEEEIGSAVSGRVKAGQVACVQGREVNVYSRRPGKDRRLEGTTTTGGGGGWELRIGPHFHPKRYFAVVTAEEKDGYLCTGARSPGLLLDRVLGIHDWPRVKSVITIHASSNHQYFHGRVKAGKRTCTKNRRVKLRLLGDDRPHVQRTRTDGDGKWELHARFPAADFAVAIVRHSYRPALMNVCEGDASRSVRWN